MKKSDIAVERMKEGFNCAQSVFSVFADGLGLDRETAYKVACGFGAGMGCSAAGVCGAVSGAVMAIGAKYGKSKADDNAAKQKTYTLVRACMEQFAAKNGTVICRDLLGCDISTPDGMQAARDTGLFRTRCTEFVRDTADILEELIQGTKETP